MYRRTYSSQTPTRSLEHRGSECKIGVGTDLQELIVRWNQITTIPGEERRNGEESVKDTVVAIQYKENESPESLVDSHKHVQTVNHNSLDKTGMIATILEPNKPEMVRKFRTKLPEFQ